MPEQRLSMSRITATLLLVSQLGCTTVTTVSSPQTYFDTHRPLRVTVTTDESRVVVIHSPRVRGDTIFGSEAAGSEIALPLSRVRQISATTRDRGKSLVAAVSLGALAAVFTAIIISLLQGNENTPVTPL